MVECEDKLSTFCVKQSASMGLSTRLANLFGGAARKGGSGSGVIAATGGFEYTQVRGYHGGSSYCSPMLFTASFNAQRESTPDCLHTHLQAAARRADQRRLLSFVRLADCMMADALHHLLVESVREVLVALEHSIDCTTATPENEATKGEQVVQAGATDLW